MHLIRVRAIRVGVRFMRVKVTVTGYGIAVKV